jgi:uncharacterized protein YukE
MSWVGGDIAGLKAMGAAMARATDKTNEVVNTLNRRVDDLANDADWLGAAAQRFRKVWSADSIQVGVINAAVTQAGTTIEALGHELRALENALHDAADEYRPKKVPIGPSGEPQAVVVTGDASKSPAKDVLQAAKEYKEIYDSTMMLAKKARTDTATSLSDLLAGLLPPEDKKSTSAKPDEWATAADYARGLLVIPDEKLKNHGQLAAELRDARQRFKATRKPLQAAKAQYAAKGLKLPATSDAALAHSRALRELNAAAEQFGQAGTPKGVLPGSTWLNVKLGDLPRAPGSGPWTKALPKELQFLKDIPVLDVAATAFIGTAQAHDDHEKGWSNSRAYTTDIGAGAIGLGAGVAAAALAPEAVPVALAAAGGGAIVVGVGNIAYDAFHEHWSEDVQSHGVVAGIGEGLGHSAWGGISDTWSQLADVSKSIWHGVFG